MDGALDLLAQARDEVGAEVLHVREHLLDVVARHEVREPRPAVLAQVDMDDVGVAEQIVHVAQDLLVSPDQEEAHVVALVLPQRVQLQDALDVTQVDEAIDLAV